MSEPKPPEDADPGLAADRDRLARTLRETRLQLAMTQARLAALEQSATMELGRTLVRAARRPWSRGVQLPADLVRLWRERGGLTGPGAATLALASAQLGDLAGGGERFLSALTAPGLGAPGVEAAGWTAPGLVVTGVLTARACATLAPDAAVHPLLPHDADVMLESAGADLVLIEAAAMLAGSAWAYAGDPAAADRGRRLGRLIAAARALGKPVIFIRNVPAHLAPGLDWVAASCDAVSDDGFGVQLARFNPIGLSGSRHGGPVYAEARDPRETPAARALLDAVTAAPGPGSVRVAGSVPWRRRPALYRDHALFVTATADQACEQVACGARVIMIGGEPAVDGVPPAGDGWDLPALRDRLAALRACPPLSTAETLPALRGIFAAQATPVRLAALARLAGLGDHVIAGRRIAVLARAADAAAAASLSAGVTGQRFLPAELVVAAEAPDAASAELSARAVTAALAGLADRGVSIRALPLVTGDPDTAGVPGPGSQAEPAGWLRRAAGAARSPWVVPWQAGGAYGDNYLLDLACARECAQADAAGYGGTGYAFTAALDPALARREFFAVGDPGHGLRLFCCQLGASALTSRALVYGDIDLNLIDGSAIWLQSVTQALARAGCAVTLVLKAPVRTSRLIAPLLAEPGVTVRRPFEEHLVERPGPLRAAAALGLLASLDADQRHDLVVLRGRAVTSAVARSKAFTGRLWPYLTDVPQSVPALTSEAADELELIASAARYLLCQTEELRCFLEGSIPAACGKCVLLPPMLADVPPARGASAAGTPLRLVYTGKFAPRWNTLEMTELPALLSARGVPSELHMAGDKIHDDAGGYQERMRAALGTDGVTWHGGHSREEAMRLAASCDIGLSWRHPDLDASLELSTKVLEFGALGLPVILNRTPMHEALLGADYPLFAAGLADVAAGAATAAAEPGLYRLAADRTGRAAERFTLDRAAERLRGYLAGAVPPRRASAGEAGTGEGGPARLLRIVVAGHDLKFFTPLLSYLRLQPDLEVRLDHWAALGKHDAAASRELAAWADVVVCEWCGPNAVWYSRHKRRGSRLLVRLHRFELRSPYPGQLKIGAVNQVICVSRHYARLCREYTGWQETKVATVPNAIDVAQLDRPKLDGARFHLGLVGMVPSRKRLDLALDVLEELRREDDRYLLFVKSAMPWEHWWVWQNPAEREHYADALRRVQRSPLLRGAVVFDDAGPDVPAWLRRVGFVLSTSDDESFHVAPAEGMASRAVPVLRHWPGAETIYDMRWIHRGPAEMAAAVMALRDEGDWRAAGDDAHAQAAAAFNLTRVCEAWRGLLTADLDPAVPGPIPELLGSL